MSKTAKSTKTTEAAPAGPLEKLLTVTDVAAILGLSKVKVYELLKQRPNELPSVKIDGARRVQPRKLEAWIEQHSEQA
jgi:excisionase family DNA binding protein